MTNIDTLPSLHRRPYGVDLEQALADRALLARCIQNPSTDWRSLQVDAAIGRLDSICEWLDSCCGQDEEYQPIGQAMDRFCGRKTDHVG